jgi:hypothetical protein
MYDKSKLGTRYVCFSCGTKFYDLNRPAPLCPECGSDQRQAPARDLRALLSSKGPRPKMDDDEPVKSKATGDDDDDDYGLLGDDDDDDDGDGDDDDDLDVDEDDD